MPIYEFICKDCGNKFEELFLKLPEKEFKVECPNCGSKNVDRVMSVSSLNSSGDFDVPSCCCCGDE